LQEAIKENEEEPEMTINTSAGSVTGMARVSTENILACGRDWGQFVF
jgi:hypothetical protein